MSPRTSLSTLAVVGALLLTTACGAPPEPPSAAEPVASVEPPAAGGLPASAAAVPSLAPSVPTYSPAPPLVVPPPLPSTTPPTTATTTTSSPPRPSRAPRCAAEPTGTQILDLVKGQPGVPDKPLKVQDGPFCSGQWSFTTIGLADSEQSEPLMVVSTGKGTSLALVAAGSDVCNAQVQTNAPVGIRVLACGS